MELRDCKFTMMNPERWRETFVLTKSQNACSVELRAERTEWLWRESSECDLRLVLVSSIPNSPTRPVSIRTENKSEDYLGPLWEATAEHSLKHMWRAWAHREDRKGRGIGVAKRETSTPIIVSNRWNVQDHRHRIAELQRFKSTRSSRMLLQSAGLEWRRQQTIILLMNSLQATIIFTSALCSTLIEFHIRCSRAAIMLRAHGIAISWVWERVCVCVCVCVCLRSSARRISHDRQTSQGRKRVLLILSWWHDEAGSLSICCSKLKQYRIALEANSTVIVSMPEIDMCSVKEIGRFKLCYSYIYVYSIPIYTIIACTPIKLLYIIV